MRTKSELYQEALRTVGARRQMARARAEDARAEAEAALPLDDAQAAALQIVNAFAGLQFHVHSASISAVNCRANCPMCRPSTSR